jgi:hypothetical protein
VEKTNSFRVTAVDQESDRVEINGGGLIVDLMGNQVHTPNTGTSDVPRQIYPAELYVGYKWAAAWKQVHPRAGHQVIEIAFKVAGFEAIDVPAGRIQAFRIDGHGWVMNQPVELHETRWVVPGFNFLVKAEITRRRQGRLFLTERWELVSAIQHIYGAACTTGLSDGKTRSLVVRANCGAVS